MKGNGAAAREPLSPALEARLDEARRVLDAAGIDAPVRAEGRGGEIAAVTGSPSLREPLARLAPRLQALGFGYVALELENGRGTRTQDP